VVALGTALALSTGSSVDASDRCVLDMFGLFSAGETSGRVTRRADAPLLEVHPRYGVSSPANRYRLQHYRDNSNFGRPYYREFFGDPWYEPLAYPGWSHGRRFRGH
jgi:hypothetical protein